jgi:hypothetical protein
MADQNSPFDPRDNNDYWSPNRSEKNKITDDDLSHDEKPQIQNDIQSENQSKNLDDLESNPDDDGNGISGGDSELSNDEISQSDKIAAGYYQTDEKTKEKRKKFSRKRIAIGAGIAGLVGGGLVSIFLILMPLKIQHLFSNVEQRFYGLATNAIEARAETILSRYMTKYTFKSLSNLTCGTMISKDCNMAYDPGKGYVSNLYQNWHNVRIEEKLFKNHGIEIKYNTNGNGRFTIITRNGLTLDGIDGDNFDLSSLRRQSVGANNVVREINRALEGETFWKKLMLRRGVRNLAKNKYNIKWCLFACDTRDNIRETRISAVKRLKLKIAERTLSPFSDRLALYMTCTITNCGSEDFLRDRSRLTNRIIEEFGEEYIEQVAKTVGNKTFKQVIIEKVFTKIFSEASGKLAAGAVPLVGIFYMVDTANEIDQLIYNGTISKFLADNAASQYAEYYLAMRSHVDEGADSQLTLEEVGAQSELFNGMEDSLVFQRELGTSSPVVATPSIFTQPAFAQEAPEEYLCANDEPVPSGELVCPERKVSQLSAADRWRQSETANTLWDLSLGFYNCGAWNIIPGVDCEHGNAADDLWPLDPALHWVFQTFEGILSGLVNVTFGIISAIPGIGDVLEQAIDWGKDKVAELFQYVMGLIIPDLHAGTGPGREVFDDLYAGADVVGNEFSKGFEVPDTGELVGLGGKKLSEVEVQENLQTVYERDLSDFQSQNLFARLFSTDSSYSVVSKAAVDLTPNNMSISGVFNYLANLFNPIKTTSYVAAGVLGNDVYAQSYQYLGDPFGIDQYGYTIDDENLNIDPEELTLESCSPGGVFYDAWYEGIKGDEDDELLPDGQIIHNVSNPCMLEQVTTNILDSWFTDEDDGGVGITTPYSSINIVTGTSPINTLSSHPNLEDYVQPNGYYQLPPAVADEYGFWGGSPPIQRCGTRELVDLAYTIGTKWGKTHPSNLILAGDLNAPGHLSHKYGVDWDIYMQSTVYRTDTYNGYLTTQEEAIELGRMLADTGIIKNIFYNDPAVISDFNSYVASQDLSGVMSEENYHWDHFHVRILDEYRGIEMSVSCEDTIFTYYLPGKIEEEIRWLG